MDASQFSIKELLKFAISLEQEGAAFYTKLAGGQSSEVKNWLLELAKDEKRHEDIFQRWYQRVDTQETDDYLFDGSVTTYFQDYAKNTGFAKRQDGSFHSASDAIELGIETEKVSIDFYAGIMPYARPEVKPVLDTILLEEKGHLNRLETYKLNL